MLWLKSATNPSSMEAALPLVSLFSYISSFGLPFSNPELNSDILKNELKLRKQEVSRLPHYRRPSMYLDGPCLPNQEQALRCRYQQLSG